MAVQKQDGIFTQTGKSASDLRDKEFYFAKRDANGKFDLAGDGDAIVGVISEGRNTDYHTSVNTKGNPILKVKAGSAITRGDAVQSDAAGTAKTGTTNSFGTAIDTVAAGEYVAIDTDAT